MILTKKVKNEELKKLWKILRPYIKMEKTSIKFGDIEIKIQKFYQHERPISTDNIDVDKIVVSNKNDFKLSSNLYTMNNI